MSLNPYLSPLPLFGPAFIPISPPAPHRSAPLPPTYTPRRSRPRHIRMREPARCGLFTVNEADEGTLHSRTSEVSLSTTSSYSDYLSVTPFSLGMPSASSSSDCLPTSEMRDILDLPRNVDSESDEDACLRHKGETSPDDSDMNIGLTRNGTVEDFLNRLSWNSSPNRNSGSVTTESDCPEARTPFTDEEENDLFDFTFPSTDSDMPKVIYDNDEQKEVTTVDDSSPRAKGSIPAKKRPSPLPYVPKYHYHPFRSTSPSSSYSNAITPRSKATYASENKSSGLLPALPILTAEEWRSLHTPTSSNSPPSSAQPSHGHHHHSRSFTKKPRSPRFPDEPVDLSSALKELLDSCGENIDIDDPKVFSSSSTNLSDDGMDLDFPTGSAESSTLSFPLPPGRTVHSSSSRFSSTSSRGSSSHSPSATSPSDCDTPLSAAFDIQTPRTPPRASSSIYRYSSPPSPCPRRRSTENRRELPKLQGDHSLLFSLTAGTGQSSPASSSSGGSYNSWSSNRSLPRRKGLPEGWMEFGETS